MLSIGAIEGFMYQLENWRAGKRHNLACYRRKRNNLRAGVAFQSLNTKFSEPYERAAIARTIYTDGLCNYRTNTLNISNGISRNYNPLKGREKERRGEKREASKGGAEIGFNYAPLPGRSHTVLRGSSARSI